MIPAMIVAVASSKSAVPRYIRPSLSILFQFYGWHFKIDIGCVLSTPDSSYKEHSSLNLTIFYLLIILRALDVQYSVCSVETAVHMFCYVSIYPINTQYL